GQILEFTIRITNTGSVQIASIDLEDRFVGSIVEPVGYGSHAELGDPPLSDTAYTYNASINPELITWSLLGDGVLLDPGESLAVIVRLRAVHPTEDLQVVNRAEIARALDIEENEVGAGNASVPALSTGATLPMTKSANPASSVSAGMPITYTILITNDGLIDIVSLPLHDIFDPNALRFASANPKPDQANQASGELTWNDLLATTGRSVLAPGETIRVLTVYTATRDIAETVNRAEVVGAQDSYGNDVQPRQAQAPIRIVGPSSDAVIVPTATPTRFPTAGPRLTAIAELTATAQAQATPTAEATAAAPTTAAAVTATVVVPATLPNTGSGGDLSPLLVLIIAISLLGSALVLRR
ncbi:MAG: hypothetical protein HGA65_13855, partial [Oscillochloris sp.]|nr:hypothetical protein [Oscillochloris sp.]